MYPVIHALVKRLVHLPVHRIRHGRSFLSAKIGSRDKNSCNPVLHNSINLFQVLQSNLALLFKNLQNVIWTPNVAHIPFFYASNPFGWRSCNPGTKAISPKPVPPKFASIALSVRVYNRSASSRRNSSSRLDIEPNSSKLSSTFKLCQSIGGYLSKASK